MRADWKLERTEEVDFRFQRADQGSKRADFRPYRTYKRPEMAEGGTKKLLDRWSNKCKVVCCTGFRSSSPLTNLPSQSADINSQV